MRALPAKELGLDDGVDVVSAEKQVILAVDLDVAAAELAVVDLVANLDVQGDALAVVGELASADGDDLALDRKSTRLNSSHP